MKRNKYWVVMCGFLAWFTLVYAATHSNIATSARHVTYLSERGKQSTFQTNEIEYCFNASLTVVSCNDALIESAITGYPLP
jgi:hypothetical protein